MARVQLADLRTMLAWVQSEYPNQASDAKGKGHAESSSSSLSSILGKRTRSEEQEQEKELLLKKLEECEQKNSRLEAAMQVFLDAAMVATRTTRDDEYNSGVKDAYLKVAEELPELRRKFRKQGWFMAIKALNLNPLKVGLGRGPPYDISPVTLANSSSEEDED